MLPPLDMEQDAQALADYVAAYCEMAGVTNRTKTSDLVGHRLVNASRRAVGTALSFAQWAVALASLRPRGALHISDFAHVAAMRTGCSPDSNMFLLDNWEELDFEKVAPVSFDEARYRDADEGEAL